MDRVKKNPMPNEQFLKHYLLTDSFSGQHLDYLQLIQLEIPRAARIMEIKKKQKKDFDEQDWWIEILVNSDHYTFDVVKKMHEQDRVMPEIVYKALSRLDVSKWDPKMVREYKEDLIDREKYTTILAAEKAEGEKIGLLKAVPSLKKQGMSTKEIASALGLTEEDVSKVLEGMPPVDGE